MTEALMKFKGRSCFSHEHPYFHGFIYTLSLAVLIRVSAYSLEANTFYPGQQNDYYFNRYVSNDFTVTVLSPGYQEPLGNACRETWIPSDTPETRVQPHPRHRLHSAAMVHARLQVC